MAQDGVSNINMSAYIAFHTAEAAPHNVHSDIDGSVDKGTDVAPPPWVPQCSVLCQFNFTQYTTPLMPLLHYR